MGRGIRDYDCHCERDQDMTGWMIYHASLRFALLCGTIVVVIHNWDALKWYLKVFGVAASLTFAIGTAAAMCGVV